MPSFADTEITENSVQDVLDIDPAGKPAQRPRRQAQLLGDQIVPTGNVSAESPAESFLCPPEGRGGGARGVIKACSPPVKWPLA